MITLFLPALLVLGFALPVPAGDFQEERRLAMVSEQLEARGIKDERVLRAMRRVPRHRLVPEEQRRRAYGDYPLPIGEGQTISQPYVVALMTDALGIQPGDRVLEVGTGSGYQAAVLAEMGARVWSIEIREGLAERARKDLSAIGYGDVRVRHADGYFGWPEHAPFDAVIITAAVNHIPPPLIRQLAAGGRLILPLGSTTFYQVLTLAEKTPDGLSLRQMGGVAFVPMLGEARKQ